MTDKHEASSESSAKSAWEPIARKLTTKDHGRRVAYTGNRYPGGVWEYGTISSFNGDVVFVLYDGKRQPQATNKSDLMWVRQ